MIKVIKCEFGYAGLENFDSGSKNKNSVKLHLTLKGKQAIQEINIFAIVAIFFRPPLKQFLFAVTFQVGRYS